MIPVWCRWNPPNRQVVLQEQGQCWPRLPSDEGTLKVIKFLGRGRGLFSNDLGNLHLCKLREGKGPLEAKAAGQGGSLSLHCLWHQAPGVSSTSLALMLLH